MTTTVPTLAWSDTAAAGASPAVLLLDQTRLPHDVEQLVCADVPALVAAIQRLVVRGAPVLGVAGGYGVALAAVLGEDVAAQAHTLATARPTAVNLAAGVQRVLAVWQHTADPAATLAEAHALAADDVAAADSMAAHGLTLVPERARVLTHCNTGRLVSAGAGSAFAVAAAAHRAGRLEHLWVDETRPLLQGARLTAFEAVEQGIGHSVLVDGAAAGLFAAGQVDLVLVGADRVAADGSVANKVGTLGLAVLAHHYDVPFVVVAPTTTVDLATVDGAAIVVEQRDGAEVLGGRTPAGTPAWNPAFDVTPPELVTALVTERGVLRSPDRESLAAHLR